MFQSMRRATILAAIVSLTTTSHLAASIITFGGLGGGGNPFTTYNEAGFTVSPTPGNWFQQSSGNPGPSIEGVSFAAVTVTNNTTGIFTFASVDLTSNALSGTTFQIQGFLSGNPVLSQNVSIGGSPFVTIASINPSQVLDSLVVTTVTSPNFLGFYNVDNINVTAAPPAVVPEPTALAIWTVLSGMGAVCGYRRRLLKK